MGYYELMIEPSVIHIEAYGRTLDLAPFGYEEMDQHLPVSEDSLQYELEHTRKAFAAGDAAPIVRSMAAESRNSFRNWGIYTDHAATENFVGFVCLGGPSPKNMNTQALACIIMPEEARRKGIGKLAMLGVTAVALHEDAEGLFGWSSVRNEASKGVMKWLGLTHVVTMPYYEFRGGEESEFWTLLPDDARGRRVMDRLTGGSGKPLWPGWERYLDRRAHANIQLDGTAPTVGPR